MKVTWELRYRSPIAPTKGVDTVAIETNSTDPKIAEAVARHWLDKERAHPSTKFVYVRPFCVQTEDAMNDELATLAGTSRKPAVQQTPGGRVGA